MPAESEVQPNVFTHRGTWDDAIREQKWMRWLEDYMRNVVEVKKWETPVEDWHVRRYRSTVLPAEIMLLAANVLKA